MRPNGEARATSGATNGTPGSRRRPSTATASGQSRGTSLGRAALMLVLALAALGMASCSSSPNHAAASQPAPQPCNGPDGVGGSVPAGMGPGDLVAAVELTHVPAYADSPGFPTGARAWRILYVSTGIDDSQLELICGIVLAPDSGPRAYGGTGRMLAWAHGTIGLSQSCLPSSDPAKHVWGAMPDGINAIAWGSGLDARQGDPSEGALQYALDQGWLVAVTDYQPNDTYIVGKIAATDVLDSARAATQLMSHVFSSSPPAYDMITWGHSQGGQAAMWAGQLAQSYLTQTHPSRPTASIRLVGVALEAPAANFVTQPALQPGTTFGDGVGDEEMHQSVGSDLPFLKNLPALQVQIGPALFSYIFGSWSELSRRGPLPSDAGFPAYPPGDAPLDLSAVATAEGRATIAGVQPLCLSGSDAKLIQKLVAKYRNAAADQMLIPSVWNLPSDYTTGSYFKGGLDKTCATTRQPDIAQWCAWILWNLPGPLGVNPYPKVPEWNGQLVPMLIAQGTDDTVIHCVAPGEAVPPASDCTSVALYDSLSQRAYCGSGAAAGHLELDLARVIPNQSPADHFSIPGQIAAAGESKAKTELVFSGSPLQLFMSGAFTGTLPPGCSVRYIN